MRADGRHRPAPEGPAWEDAQGQAWLAYNDPAWLMQRHGAAACPPAANVAKALAGLAEAATAK